MRVYQFENFNSFFSACQKAVKENCLANVHTPIHHEELDELLNIKPRFVNLGYYIGGLLGILTAALITIIPNLFTFTINVGGRPLMSWPAFVIIMFELMILFASIGSILGFFFTQRYPRYDREIFDLNAFNTKENGEYFLVTRKDLKGHGAHHFYRLS